LAIGLALTWLAMPLIRGQLYGVGATDPIALGAVIGLFLLVAVLAALAPARRAAQAEPALALK
jgi:hypothetical protein